MGDHVQARHVVRGNRRRPEDIATECVQQSQGNGNIYVHTQERPPEGRPLFIEYIFTQFLRCERVTSIKLEYIHCTTLPQILSIDLWVSQPTYMNGYVW